jgi:chromosome partitioning protein
VRTWAFVSQKGGCHKTTISCNIAAYAVECGEKVCIIDLDPQHNAHDWYEFRESPVPDVISALPERLPKLQSAAAEMGVTLFLIDTPPHTSASSIAAIRSASLIITPAQPNMFDLLALRDTIELLSQTNRLAHSVCVITGVTPQGNPASSFADAQMAAEAMGITVSPAYLMHRKPFASCLAKGMGVTEFAPKDKAADELRSLWADLNQRSPLVTAEERELT